VALEHGGRLGSSELGGSGGAFGRGRGLRECGAHHDLVLARVVVGKTAGGGLRRRRAAPATGTVAPARRLVWLGHKEHGELGYCKGEALGKLMGCASAPKGQLGDDGGSGRAAIVCASEGGHGERLYS
jgi:hypothetical protein